MGSITSDATSNDIMWNYSPKSCEMPDATNLDAAPICEAKTTDYDFTVYMETTEFPAVTPAVHNFYATQRAGTVFGLFRIEGIAEPSFVFANISESRNKMVGVIVGIGDDNHGLFWAEPWSSQSAVQEIDGKALDSFEIQKRRNLIVITLEYSSEVTKQTLVEDTGNYFMLVHGAKTRVQLPSLQAQQPPSYTEDQTVTLKTLQGLYDHQKRIVIGSKTPVDLKNIMELTAQEAEIIKNMNAADKMNQLNQWQKRKGTPNVIIEFQKEPMFTLGLFMEDNQRQAKTLLMKVNSDPDKNACLEITDTGDQIQGTTSLNDPADQSDNELSFNCIGAADPKNIYQFKSELKKWEPVDSNSEVVWAHYAEFGATWGYVENTQRLPVDKRKNSYVFFGVYAKDGIRGVYYPNYGGPKGVFMAKYPENPDFMPQVVCYYFLDLENQNLFRKNCVRGQVNHTGTSTSGDFPRLECENKSKSFHPRDFF